MTKDEFIEKLMKMKMLFINAGYQTRKETIEEIIPMAEKLDLTQAIEPKRLLLIEDGSIDLEKEKESLEALEYKVLVYRQGSNKPEIINI